MNVNQNNINLLLNNYVSFVDEISDDNKYDDNIRHLLYIIVPAFIARYSSVKEPTILKCFSNVKITIKELADNTLATFSRNLKKVNGEYVTDKYIAIKPFKESSLSSILDTIIHEFNHAINSINNEIKIDNDYVKVRTGLTYLNYNKDTLDFVSKSNETVLEELLNTLQTEDILNIIKSFGDYDIENMEIANTIYNVCNELKNKQYVSDAYRFQRQICNDLMNNKTFIPTANQLRLKGDIDDIMILFDDVIGKKGSYKKLNDLLTEMHKEILKYDKNKLLKNKNLNKIKELANSVTNLIKEYELKCIFR